ncbi:hypothetical protein BaRGS_00009176 [Batillaria attramentaria]|uniref:Uncharacterized protein n=1 Tax=Batillaria attramentaria TaxID=370345 RepID=A0ABD0LKQ0_9CAEN
MFSDARRRCVIRNRLASGLAVPNLLTDDVIDRMLHRLTLAVAAAGSQGRCEYLDSFPTDSSDNDTSLNHSRYDVSRKTRSWAARCIVIIVSISTACLNTWLLLLEATNCEQ